MPGPRWVFLSLGGDPTHTNMHQKCGGLIQASKRLIAFKFMLLNLKFEIITENNIRKYLNIQNIIMLLKAQNMNFGFFSRD